MSALGLLFLLLVTSSLPAFSAPPETSPSLEKGQMDQESHDNQHKDKFRKLGSWLKKNFRDIGEVLIASLEPVPVAGQPIAGALKTLLLLTPQADALDSVNSELKALHVKFDTFQTEVKWDTWAAAAFQTPVNNIERAWVKYNELKLGAEQTTAKDKEALKENFFTFYSQYTDSTLVLHQYLTAKPGSITQNLGDLLADRLRCHEKDIKAQFLYLNKLMYKGNMLNEMYSQFKGTNTKAKDNAANKIASQAASALTTSQQRCLSDSAAYVDRDIFEHIDDTRRHQQIADNIRAFLVKTYDRYDWVVVAFTTQNSKHKPKLLNRHVLSGFTEVQRGAVTVAVAKQVKGSHTKTAAVKEAIKKCLHEKFICSDVAKKLEKCEETVFGKSLSQTYTAVHAFKRKSQTSSSAVEAPDDDEDSELTESAHSSSPASLFTGKCGKVFGNFMVFIKSDEEIMGKSPCSKLNCGQKGKCVVVSGTIIAMCECQYPYYGEHCEMSLDSDKRRLQWEPERKTQTPDRFRKGKSVPPDSRRSLQHTHGYSARSQSLQPIPEHSANSGPRQRNSRGSAKRRPRQKTSRGSAKRRPQQRNSRGSAKRRPKQRNSRGSAKRRPQQRNSRGYAKRSPSPNNKRHSTRERSNSRSLQHTPGSTANRGGSIKAFCGSLCEDEATG